MPKPITMRDLYELTKDEPVMCLISMCDVARSIHQQEPATLEGACGTALELLKQTNTKDPAEAAERFMEILGPMADKEISPGLLKMIVTSD